jgi:hypothetical protein
MAKDMVMYSWLALACGCSVFIRAPTRTLCLVVVVRHVAASAHLLGQDEDLARVHDVRGVERPLHRALQVEVVLA